MANFPTEFAEQLTPLPTDLGSIGNAAAGKLAAKGYEVQAGLTRFYAGGIAVMACQKHIAAFCPDDATLSRFATEESTAEWLKKGDESLDLKGRGMFLLLKQGEGGVRQLAGYGWTGPEHCPYIQNSKTTFAIRIGEGSTGQGLSLPFTQLIVAGTAKLFEARNIWLETWSANKVVRTYLMAGFETVTEKHARGATSSRLYMKLPNRFVPEV